MPTYNQGMRRMLETVYTWLFLVFGETLGNACTGSASPNQPFKY